LLGGSARRLTNYQQIFEALLSQTARAPASLGDLVRRLSALADRSVVPTPEEGNVQRSEGERDAVQIMTSHKAKGLEADHVFLYGAFSPFHGYGVKAYARDGERVLYVGRARRRAVDDALRAEQEAEDQRLFYVALTRARRRIYLPYAGTDAVEREASQDDKVFWRVTGAYRHVHRRLRALRDGGFAGARDARFQFEARAVICPPAPDATAARAAAALAGYRPGAGALALVPPPAGLGELRRRHAGVTLTSYTRLKEAAGGHHPPTEVLDEVGAGGLDALAPDEGAGAEAAPARGDSLPGGTLSGIFLHAVLEAVPLGTLGGTPPVERWAALPEIEALFSTAMRRHDRDPRHRGDAERLVHAALTTPLPLGEGAPLAGVAAAARVAREVEFLFPFPGAAGGADRGFVKGYIDFVLEHEGRAWFGDWKSDLLPDWSAATVAARVADSYEIQRRLYALALVKMLGIADRADYEARFGGTIYVFVRGLPGGLDVRRPAWDEIARWQQELAAALEVT
jgi:exodeoxyribonuclease V beta subunit